MRNLQKLLALALALVMMLSFGLTAMAKDISEATDAESAAETLAKYEDLEGVYTEAVQNMLDLGIIRGDAAGNLLLDKAYSRVEFAVMLWFAQSGGADIPARYKQQKSIFTDIPEDHWAKPYTNWAASQEIFSGSSTTQMVFTPDRLITIEEALFAVMRALGVDGDVKSTLVPNQWDGTAQLAVAQIAEKLNIYGDLYTLDEENVLNRAEACLLVWYYINSPTFSYDPVTFAVSANATETALLNSAFKMTSGKYVVLSDGKWFDLRDNAPDGKVYIQKWDKSVAAKQVTGAVIELDAAVVKELGVEFSTVGHVFDLTFKLDGSKATKLYSAKQVSTENVNTNGTGGENKGVSALGTVTNTTYYLNYANKASNVWASDKLNKVGAWGGYVTVSGFETATPANTSTTLANTAGWTWTITGFKANAFYNHTIRSIICDGVVLYAFGEVYDAAVFKEIDSDGKFASVATGGDGRHVINGVKPEKIYGYDAKTWAAGDPLAVYWIGDGNTRVGVIPADIVTGNVTSLSGDAKTLGVDSKSYTGAFHNIAKNNYAAASGTVQTFTGVALNQDITLYVWRDNKVLGFTDGPNSAPASYSDYCLVTASAVSLVAGNPLIPGSDSYTYQVKLLLADGTEDVYDLVNIISANTAATGASTSKSGVPQGINATLNTEGYYGNTGSSASSLAIQYRGATGGVFASATPIDEKVFGCSFSGNKVTLYEIMFSGASEVNVSSGVLTYTANAATLNSKYLTEKSVVFVKITGTPATYKAYTGIIPVGITSATGAYFKAATVAGVLDSTGPAVGVAYLTTATALTGAVVDWAVALGAPGSEINAATGKERQVLSVLTKAGVETFYSADNTAFAGVVKGYVFTYVGEKTAVASISADNYTKAGDVLAFVPAINAIQTGTSSHRLFYPNTKYYYIEAGADGANQKPAALIGATSEWIKSGSTYEYYVLSPASSPEVPGDVLIVKGTLVTPVAADKSATFTGASETVLFVSITGAVFKAQDLLTTNMTTWFTGDVGTISAVERISDTLVALTTDAVGSGASKSVTVKKESFTGIATGATATPQKPVTPTITLRISGDLEVTYNLDISKLKSGFDKSLFDLGANKALGFTPNGTSSVTVRYTAGVTASDASTSFAIDAANFIAPVASITGSTNAAAATGNKFAGMVQTSAWTAVVPFVAGADGVTTNKFSYDAATKTLYYGAFKDTITFTSGSDADIALDKLFKSLVNTDTIGIDEYGLLKAITQNAAAAADVAYNLDASFCADMLTITKKDGATTMKLVGTANDVIIKSSTSSATNTYNIEELVANVTTGETANFKSDSIINAKGGTLNVLVDIATLNVIGDLTVNVGHPATTAAKATITAMNVYSGNVTINSTYNASEVATLTVISGNVTANKAAAATLVITDLLVTAENGTDQGAGSFSVADPTGAGLAVTLDDDIKFNTSSTATNDISKATITAIAKLIINKGTVKLPVDATGFKVVGADSSGQNYAKTTKAASAVDSNSTPINLNGTDTNNGTLQFTDSSAGISTVNLGAVSTAATATYGYYWGSAADLSVPANVIGKITLTIVAGTNAYNSITIEIPAP